MSKLALAGGKPVRSKKFPAWPAFDKKEERALSAVLKNRSWGGYPFPNVEAKKFAAAFARAHGARHGVCVANGTVALEAALEACGVGPGDEVIVPAYTWEGTAAPVLFAGAAPVFVDVDPDTYCLDALKVAAALTTRTKAIIPVHLAMGMADMDALLALARARSIAVIEDCAHAHGAKWKGRGAGSLGDAGCFSFQTSKLMTAGEGGLVLTSDEAVLEALGALVNCGRPFGRDRSKRRVLGHNYRMTEFQAAVLSCQLSRLSEQTARRARSAERLSRALTEIGGVKPLRRDPRVTTPAVYQFVFRYDPARFEGASRDAFVAALEAEGVPCDGMFYEPIYRSSLFHADAARYPALASYDLSRVSCPVAERAAYHEAVWLPHWLLLGAASDMDQIADAVLKIQRNAGELARLKHPKIAEKGMSRSARARLELRKGSIQ